MSEPGLASLCVVVPCFNEEAVIGAFHARLIAALDALPVAAQVLYVDDGSRDRTAAAIAGLCAARPARGRAAPVAQLRQGTGADLRPRPRRGRRRGGDRRRPAGPAGADRDALDALPRGPRRGVRGAALARRRVLAQARHRQRVLPRDRPPLRHAGARRHRRFPPAVAARGARAARAARAPSLHEGPVRLGRLLPARHAVRPRPARRRQQQVELVAAVELRDRGHHQLQRGAAARGDLRRPAQRRAGLRLRRPGSSPRPCCGAIRWRATRR